MQDDLTTLETWASTPLAKLDPAARRKLTSQLTQDLRRQQQTRIQA
ncbi:phage virion morphogenesis protein [Undibacterium umbellatum]|nr:phage virion morphogenesis protein [Undibacterium umbellatum]